MNKFMKEFIQTLIEARCRQADLYLRHLTIKI